jgi:hypothetical protein
LQAGRHHGRLADAGAAGAGAAGGRRPAAGDPFGRLHGEGVHRARHLDSIELRGTLEGLAARFAAERGVSARSLEPLKECLADLDQLVRQDPISVEAFSAYVTMNARFTRCSTNYPPARR